MACSTNGLGTNKHLQPIKNIKLSLIVHAKISSKGSTRIKTLKEYNLQKEENHLDDNGGEHLQHCCSCKLLFAFNYTLLSSWFGQVEKNTMRCLMIILSWSVQSGVCQEKEMVKKLTLYRILRENWSQNCISFIEIDSQCGERLFCIQPKSYSFASVPSLLRLSNWKIIVLNDMQTKH